MLFSSSALLGLIAIGRTQSRAPDAKHWWGLARVFLYISLDEAAQLHEHATWFRTNGGFLYFSWIIPGSIAVLVFGATYFGFLLNLPVRHRNNFAIAGAVYVTGALLMEMPLGYWADLEGSHNFVYGMIDLIEESMEMIGVSLFTLALLEYLAAPVGAIRVAVRGG